MYVHISFKPDTLACRSPSIETRVRKVFKFLKRNTTPTRMIKIDKRTKQKTNWKRNANPFHHFQCESSTAFLLFVCILLKLYTSFGITLPYENGIAKRGGRKRNWKSIHMLQFNLQMQLIPVTLFQMSICFVLQLSSASNNELEMKYILDRKQFHWTRNSLKQDIENVRCCPSIHFSFLL